MILDHFEIFFFYCLFYNEYKYILFKINVIAYTLGLRPQVKIIVFYIW